MTRLSASLPLCLSVSLCLSLSLCLFVCLSVCLSPSQPLPPFLSVSLFPLLLSCFSTPPPLPSTPSTGRVRRATDENTPLRPVEALGPERAKNFDRIHLHCGISLPTSVLLRTNMCFFHVVIVVVLCTPCFFLSSSWYYYAKSGFMARHRSQTRVHRAGREPNQGSDSR